jgi:hypothetical protein
VFAQQQQPFLPEAVSAKCKRVCDICGCIRLTHGQSKKADTFPDTVLFAARTNRKKEAASFCSMALPCLIVERRTVLQRRMQQRPQQQRQLLAKATSLH